MTSKYLNTVAVQDTRRRLRTYRAYVRTQPQTGWGRDAAQNGNLELTAIAGAGL